MKKKLALWQVSNNEVHQSIKQPPAQPQQPFIDKCTYSDIFWTGYCCQCVVITLFGVVHSTKPLTMFDVFRHASTHASCTTCGLLYKDRHCESIERLCVHSWLTHVDLAGVWFGLKADAATYREGRRGPRLSNWQKRSPCLRDAQVQRQQQ